MRGLRTFLGFPPMSSLSQPACHTLNFLVRELMMMAVVGQKRHNLLVKNTSFIFALCPMQAADALADSRSSKVAGKAFFVTNQEPRRFWTMMGDVCQVRNGTKWNKAWELFLFGQMPDQTPCSTINQLRSQGRVPNWRLQVMLEPLCSQIFWQTYGRQLYFCCYRKVPSAKTLPGTMDL